MWPSSSSSMSRACRVGVSRPVRANRASRPRGLKPIASSKGLSRPVWPAKPGWGVQLATEVTAEIGVQAAGHSSRMSWALSTSFAPCLIREWHPRDWAAWIQRQPGGNERTRLQGCLDDQGALAEACNDAVSLGEIGCKGRGAQWVFAKNQSVLGDAMGQVAVLAGVDPVQSGAHDCNGCQCSGFGTLQRAFMCRTINSQG